MRIAFLWDWDNDLHQMATWKDGLAAAIRILASRHELKFFTCGKTDFVFPHDYFDIHVVRSGEPMVEAVRAFAPDVILIWGDQTRPHAGPLKILGKPMALCFAGGDPFGPNWALWDHIFCESQSYLMKYQNVGGVSTSIAFGTNTELFDPAHMRLKGQEKKFDVIFPATFALWKRHQLFAEATKGLSTVCSGFMYMDHEQECWQFPQASGALVLPHVSAETLAHLYAASRSCLITSIWYGGSQRTVLEAMAMNCPLVVMSDSDKTSEYVLDCEEGSVVDPRSEVVREAVEEAMQKKVNTRPYILDKWSEKCYADALEAGLKKITGL